MAKHKKLLSLVLVCSMIISIVACSNSPKMNNSSEESNSGGDEGIDANPTLMAPYE